MLANGYDLQRSIRKQPGSLDATAWTGVEDVGAHHGFHTVECIVVGYNRKAKALHAL